MMNRIRFTNGRYKGEMTNGKMHGHGKYIFNSQATYVGEFENEMFHGYGIYSWPSGKIYVGHYCQNIRSGMGILIIPGHGSIYSGEWDTDKRNGCGIEVASDGVFWGLWKENVRHGLGHFLSAEDLSLWQQHWNAGEMTSSMLLTKSDRSVIADLVTTVMSTFDTICKVRRSGLTFSLPAAVQASNRLPVNTSPTKHHDNSTEADTTDCCLCKIMRCGICFARPRNCVLLPCTHLLYCSQCIEQLQSNSCPACRSPISGKLVCLLVATTDDKTDGAS